MRIVFDLNRCLGYAQCNPLAPDVLKLNGKEVVMHDPHPDDSRRLRVLTVSRQGHYSEQLVFSGLEEGELDQLREWFCNTKPIGPSVKIIMTSASGMQTGFGVTGNEPGPFEKALKRSGC